MLPLIFICTGEPTEMNRSEALCRAITSSSWLKGLLVLPGLVPLMVFCVSGREAARGPPCVASPDQAGPESGIRPAQQVIDGGLGPRLGIDPLHDDGTRQADASILRR